MVERAGIKGGGSFGELCKEQGNGNGWVMGGGRVEGGVVINNMAPAYLSCSLLYCVACFLTLKYALKTWWEFVWTAAGGIHQPFTCDVCIRTRQFTVRVSAVIILYWEPADCMGTSTWNWGTDTWYWGTGTWYWGTDTWYWVQVPDTGV